VQGWYGADCALAAEGVKDEPVKPPANIATVLVNPLPARQHGPARPERRRPLIYVYDMNPEFTSRWGRLAVGGWLGRPPAAAALPRAACRGAAVSPADGCT
jgi:hypothetical protein